MFFSNFTLNKALYLSHLLQEPNNQFKFYETSASPYAKIDLEGTVRVKADLDPAGSEFNVSFLFLFCLFCDLL